jgi:2'-5' RNA ligase
LKKMKINADQHELEVRWTHPSHFHVTLVFLGNTAENKIPEIESLVDETAATIAPFDLKITGVGAYPDEFASRVLWFGVQNSKYLRFLQSELAEKLAPFQYRSEEQGYNPHMTIARLRNPHRTKDMTSPFVRKSIAKIHVTELVLYESVGDAPFPVYKALRRFALSGVKADESTE